MKLLHLFMDEITMDPLHAVYLTVGLFVITFFNPGANLFVVVQTSLASRSTRRGVDRAGRGAGRCILFRVGFVWSCNANYAVWGDFFAYQNRRRRLSLMVCVV